jgi:hypothetical protein
MLLPYRTLAAGLILCGTTLSCVALPAGSSAMRFGRDAFIPAEWRSPEEKGSPEMGNASVRDDAGFSRDRGYRRHRHYRHYRHHRRGRHHHRFFFF